MASKMFRFASVLAKNAKPALKSRCMSTKGVSYKEAVRNIPDTQVSALKNGLRVATEESAGKTCTVGVWIDAGSRYETEQNNGVANFFEHMAFKGTSKRSQTDLENEIETMGAYLNAYTTRDRTAFYVKCLSKDVGKAVDILADIVQNTQFGDKEIEAERSCILREMQEIEQNSIQDVMFDYLHATAFQGTPLGQSVLGTTANVQKITKTDLAEYVSANFKSPRMVLAGAGGVSHSELVDLANKHFTKVSGSYENQIPPLATCRFTGSDLRFQEDDMPYGHVAIAVEGVGYDSPDRLPLSLASLTIGSWDRTHGGGKNIGSDLAKAIGGHHYGHSFQSFNVSYQDTGLWGIYFVGDRMLLQENADEILYEWRNLTTTYDDKECERAKNLLRTNLIVNLDGTTPVCDEIGRHVLSYGHRISPAELDAKIEHISAGDVRKACDRYVYDICPAVAALGPVESLLDYTVLRARMRWIRA